MSARGTLRWIAVSMTLVACKAVVPRPVDAAPAAAVDGGDDAAAGDAGRADAAPPIDAGSADMAMAVDAASPPSDASPPVGLVDARPAVDGSSLRWWTTCGDPVCRGWTPKEGVKVCTTEHDGDKCDVADAYCDPGTSGCNELLLCTDHDPSVVCPISTRAAKRDIRYLDDQDVAALAEITRKLRLARYTYRDDPAATPRLGFIIEDGAPPEAVNSARSRVDLYAVTSMALGALQAQAREIDELRRELEELRQGAALECRP